MADRSTETQKKTVIAPWDGSQKFWMGPGEYTGLVVGKDATQSDYVISDGVIGPGGHIPDHYHKWEDQSFHIIEGDLEIKIGDTVSKAGPGDTIHCPRGVSHYMKNVGDSPAKLISYIFPGDWAEDFMAETSRQNQTGDRDLKLIEERFGVVYL